MALILSIDTSEKICSVALSNNYELLSTLEISEEKSHAAKLTVLIKKLFSEKEIDVNKLSAVAVCKGPGSYTGLRIGVSVAKGICYALDIPLISISSLQLLCLGLIYEGWLRKIETSDRNLLLCPLIDARRMEVYKAFFNNIGEQIGTIEAEIIHENSFYDELIANKIVFFGSGAEKCKSIIQNQNAYFIDKIKPNASYMVSFAYDSFVQKKFENYAYFEPFYLKDFVATVSKKRIVFF
jgi:tRNA threonylcarbamoyladenosine biosynthesis protein TsaB